MVKASANTDIYFSYDGKGNFEEINIQLIKLNEMLEKADLPLVCRKRVYSISIELLYNVVYHGIPKVDDASGKLDFEIIEKSNYILISAGNFMKHTEAEKFRSVVCKLGALPFDELRKMKSKQILTGGISEKGGAGLGLIDIHMKSGHPAEMSFKVHNEEIDWVNMKVRVDIA